MSLSLISYLFGHLLPFLMSGFLSLHSEKSQQQPHLQQDVLAHMRFHCNFTAQMKVDKSNWQIAADSVYIPLRRAGRLLMMEASIDGETGYLVFDTGASGLVLNRTYFRDHVVIKNQSSSGITGTVDRIEQIAIDRLEISGMVYTSLTAGMTNLSHIENRRGVKVLGLFGFALFKNFEIVIDIQNNQVRIYKIDPRGNRLDVSTRKFLADYTQNIEVKNDILFLKGLIGGKILKFCFDTGAETNVIDNHSSRDILKTITITRRTDLKGVGQDTNEVLFGKMNEFYFGSSQLTGMETILVNLDALREAYDTQFDGMLGFNFLQKGIFCINFTKKQMGISFTNQEEI